VQSIRHPVYAGAFYESSAGSCRAHATRLTDAAELPADLPKTLYGGLVPHAGWVYSGPLAAMTFKALAATGPPQTVVLFGADHRGGVRAGEVFEAGIWRTPLGEVPIDEELAGELLAAADALRANPGAHVEEHSLEVQVPLLQVLMPDVKIVPIAAPASPLAVEIGTAVGGVLKDRPSVRVVGSTDLTHHGGGHFPAPGGRGRQGADWARKNDRRMLDLVEKMAIGEIVPEAHANGNACGAGAIAATAAACKAMGARRGIVLKYTNSYEVVHERLPDDPDDTTVGYASVVFA